MPPSDEARLIALWEQGATQAQIAAALGIPHGTVKSRAHTLQQQGKIQDRPRGGLVPLQRPVQSTVQPQDTGADHGPAPYPKGKAVRWNVWILDAIREEIATLAAKRDLSPSQLV